MTADHELDPLVRRAAEALRRPVAPAPDFDARVLAAVRGESARGPVAWLLRPRPLRVAPLGVLAAAAVVAAVAVAGTWAALRDRAGAARPDVAAIAAPAMPPVRFVIAVPGARRVTLVGSFNDWNPEATPLRPEAAGKVWVVEVPLEPGRHEYAFVVDGERWLADPSAPAAAGDFGVPNSVVTVAGRS